MFLDYSYYLILFYFVYVKYFSINIMKGDIFMYLSFFEG